MKSTATIMYIPEEIIDGSEFARLNNQFPEAANHDGVNKVFPLVLEDAVNPIIVNNMVNEEGEKLAGDELLAAVASVLFADDRTPPIQISYSDLQTLFDSEVYQQYAMAKDLPEAEMLQTRAEIKAYFTGS